MNSMCPHCGELFEQSTPLVPDHDDGNPSTMMLCHGSQQNWRNPESDARLLWNGKPNPHFGKQEAE